MFELLSLAATAGVTFFGFSFTRNFVRSKLRFVDAAHNGAAPWVAGIATALVTAPVFGVLGILPIIYTGMAGFLGLGVGAGVAVGSSDIRRQRLNP